MSPSLEKTINRRRFQQLGIATAAAIAIPGLNLHATGASTPEATPAAYVPPTPSCDDGDDDDLTITQTEGPYFTMNSPERTSLVEADMTADRFIVTGYVYSTDCKPVAKALLDFWHCDDQGVYDNEGYRLRGHLFTDDDGLYRLETIKPGVYPGRTRHFHLKVQAPNGPVITTQLYFPGEPENEGDGIYNAALEMEIIEPEGEGDPETGIYTFIVETAGE